MSKMEYINEIVSLLNNVNEESFFIFIKTILEGYQQ